MKKLLFLLVLIAGCFAGAIFWVSRHNEKTQEDNRYTLVPAEYGRAAEIVNATGLVQAGDVFPVGTELAGKVTEVLADFNQVVKEGDVLLRLDDRMAREKLRQTEIAVNLAKVSLKQAEANRDTAAKALQRVREQSPEVRRQVDVDVAESQLQAAKVGVEAAQVHIQEAEESRQQAELGLKLHTIRAPVLSPDSYSASASLSTSRGIGVLAGERIPPNRQDRRSFTVIDRHVSLNQQIGPPGSATLFTLAGAMDRMQVQVQVAEGDINKIVPGLEADFTVPGADGDIAFEGTISEVRPVPTGDRGAVFYKVIVDVRNRRNPVSGDWQLRQGLTASVDIVRRVHDPVWKISSAALNFQPDPSQLSEAAKTRLVQLPDAHWKTVWVLGSDEKPWPLFVRLGGVNARGESGIQDTLSAEVLEWDPTLSPRPDPKDASTYPHIIIGGPPARKSGLFNTPDIKF